MPRSRVRALDHTGDVGFEIRAPTAETLFEAARAALLAELLKRAPRAGSETLRLELEAPALDRLLLRWLDELLFLVQTRGLVPARTSELALDPPEPPERAGWRLRARLAVASLDVDAHGWHGELKGVTYHGLTVEGDGGGWRARVIFDV